MPETWVGGDGTGDEQTDSSRAANWSGGVPGSGDEVVIPNTTHECRLVTSYTWGSLELEASSEIDGNGKTLTLDDGGVAAVFNSVGTITGILDIKCNGSTGRNIYNNGTGKIRNLEIDRTGVVFTLTFTLRLDGTLTITTDSELDTGANRLLSMTGTTTIDGTLTANSSAITFGDDVTCEGEYSATDGDTVLYGNWRSAASKITHNGGTFKWATTAADGATIAANGSANSTTGINNIEISGSGITVTPNEWDLSIYGYLTITLGELDTRGSYGGGTDFALTVAGPTIVGDGSAVADTATLTCNDSTIALGSGIAAWGLHVKEGGTFNGGTGGHNMSSLANDNDSASDITLTTGITRINHEHEANNYCVKLFAGGTFAHGGGTINIEPVGTYVASVTRIYGFYAANTANNITLNAAGQTLHQDTPLIHMAGDLTITAGTWNTADTGGSAKNLTVAGTTQVTGTLTCNASAVSLGTGLTSGWGLDIQSGGTFTGGSGTHTIGSIFAAAGGTRTITLSSGATTINSKNTSNGYTINLASGATFNHGSGTVTMTYAGATLIQLSSGTLAFNTFTYNASGRTLELRSPMSCAGNLTITAGTLDTGSDHALTVTGLTVVGAGGAAGAAVLTCNASAVSLGSGVTSEFALTVNQGGTFTGGTGTHTIGSLLQANHADSNVTLTTGVTTVNSENASGAGGDYAWIVYANCTFDDGNGTVTFTFAGATRIYHQTDPLYNVIINHSSAVYTLAQSLTVANNLTITAGQLLPTTNGLTVTADCLISSGGTLTGVADAITLGSLTIASGGTYIATSGTTTLNGTSGDLFECPGTFTHNDGTLKFDRNGLSQHWYVDEAITLYNLIINSNLVRNSGGTHLLTVLNDITINASNSWKFTAGSAGRYLTVGSSTNQGAIINNGNFYLGGDGTGDVRIYGGDELKPILISGNDFDWDDETSGSGVVALKWIDYDPDVTTGGDGVTIQLDGDCEFDAVTVSATDELDLNGQRMKHAGTLAVDSSGFLDAEDALLVCEGAYDVYPDVTNADSGSMILRNSGGLRNINNWKNCFIDSASAVPVGNHITGVENFWGKGWNPDNINLSATNITIPVGATMQGDSTTITCSGDFNVAGGLIGPSCFSSAAQGDVAYIKTTTDYRIADTIGSVECWVKEPIGGTDINVIISSCDTDGSNYWALYTADGEIFQDAGGESNVSSYESGVSDGKWHHICVTVSASESLLYIDGKLSVNQASNPPLWFSDVSNRDNLAIGMLQYDGEGIVTDYMYKGEIDELRLWSTVRTPTEIRANMFSEVATDATGLVGYWKLNTGSGTTVYGSCTNVTDVDIVEYALGKNGWAGAGGFTDGTSTLDLTGNGTWYISDTATEYYNVKVASVIGGSKTTTIESVGAASRKPKITNLLTHGGGTLAGTNDPEMNIMGTGSISSGADLSGLTFTTWNSTTPIPNATFKYLTINGNYDIAGDITATSYIQVYGDTDLGNNNITSPRIISYADSSFTMGSGKITFTSSNGWGPNVYDNRSFSAGPGAKIIGPAGKCTFAAGNNWSIVGNIENLDVTNEELSVLGNVTNCTGEIHRWNPTIDTGQMLDADTADDRDVRLGSDLDRNTELVT